MQAAHLRARRNTNNTKPIHAPSPKLRDSKSTQKIPQKNESHQPVTMANMQPFEADLRSEDKPANEPEDSDESEMRRAAVAKLLPNLSNTGEANPGGNPASTSFVGPTIMPSSMGLSMGINPVPP